MDIHEKVSFDTKARKREKNYIKLYLNENLRWWRKSFVHCHLMECNSRYNKTYDIQKRANLMRENTTFYISNKVGVYETFYIWKTMGVKICKICKDYLPHCYDFVTQSFVLSGAGLSFLINTCVNLHTHCFVEIKVTKTWNVIRKCIYKARCFKSLTFKSYLFLWNFFECNNLKIHDKIWAH